jgi:uroporphyrinogen decarboxylase
LQGNLDPDVLYESPDAIREKVSALVDSMQGDPAFILNLGHGVKPDMAVESVEAFVNYAR